MAYVYAIIIDDVVRYIGKGKGRRNQIRRKCIGSIRRIATRFMHHNAAKKVKRAARQRSNDGPSRNSARR